MASPSFGSGEPSAPPVPAVGFATPLPEAQDLGHWEAPVSESNKPPKLRKALRSLTETGRTNLRREKLRLLLADGADDATVRAKVSKMFGKPSTRPLFYERVRPALGEEGRGNVVYERDDAALTPLEMVHGYELASREYAFHLPGVARLPAWNYFGEVRTTHPQSPEKRTLLERLRDPKGRKSEAEHLQQTIEHPRGQDFLVPHGFGIREYPNPASQYGRSGRYVGFFEQGLRVGEGRVDSTAGVLWARFVDDRAHGPGKFVFPNQGTFEGTYQMGHAEGSGHYTAPDGLRTHGQLVLGWMQNQNRRVELVSPPGPSLGGSGAPSALKSGQVDGASTFDGGGAKSFYVSPDLWVTERESFATREGQKMRSVQEHGPSGESRVPKDPRVTVTARLDPVLSEEGKKK